MPAYNEEAAIAPVVKAWSIVLSAVVPDHTLYVLNDGSKDGTLAKLRSLEKEMPNLKVVDKQNTGHGPTCVEGYTLALREGADWILQIDSDGQCDPCYFESLWRLREKHPVIYGFRRKREDGMLRLFISRCISVLIVLSCGVWVRDSNVPYRLMRRDALLKALPNIPADFSLANILLSVFQESQTGITWVPIVFRTRTGGVSSMKMRTFLPHARALMSQLRRSSRLLRRTA